MSENTETIELTVAIFQALLNTTGGDVDLQPPPVRALVRALHQAKWISSSRWRVDLEAGDIRTLEGILQVWYQDNPHNRARFTNHMCRQSGLFELLSARRIGRRIQEAREAAQ